MDEFMQAFKTSSERASVSDTKAVKVTAKTTTGIVINNQTDHSQIGENFVPS